MRDPITASREAFIGQEEAAGCAVRRSSRTRPQQMTIPYQQQACQQGLKDPVDRRMYTRAAQMLVATWAKMIPQGFRK